MKILQVIPSISSVHGGPSRAIIEIEQALAVRGIEVTTVTTDDDGDDRTLLVPIGVPVATPFATRWYFPRTTVLYKVSVGLGRWLRQNLHAFDLVHTHALFSFAPVAASFIARQAGVPYVVRPLGVLAHYGMTKHRPLIKRASLAFVERRLIKSANAIHFTSSDELNEAAELGLKCRGVVIPLGIDVDRAPTASPSAGVTRETDAFNLLFLSRIDRKKNLEGLLQAVRLLRAKNLNVKLNVAGDGDPIYVAKLKSLARDLNIHDHVSWLGHIFGDQKNEVMVAASALALPSHSENFGLAVAEALAVGLPCLVSRGVAIAGNIEKAGAGIVTGTTPTEIAAGLEVLFVQARSSPVMAAAARALAHNEFSLDVMGARLELLYRDILAPTSCGRLALAS